jgi:serine/threonine-protein kinase
MSPVLERAGTVLAERYVLERELGRGGMATVYLGSDLRHSRQVAVKILRPELAASLGRDRFLREIEIASRLTHPHILPLHDSGDADGLLYYVMPFVEGETLRERLQREGPLPVDDAVRIAREVGEALDFAHARGIVHRDVKPGNILLEDTHAVVADFGIAKAISSAGGDVSTSAGLVVGTPAYMSPEQLIANGPVDGRADIYSLGCVVFEMLTGKPPFHGQSMQEVAAKHLYAEPPALRSLVPALSERVERAVAVALAKQPEQRFATAAEFIESLAGTRSFPAKRRPWRRPWVVLPAIALGLAALAVALASRPPPPPLDAGRVVVFPFAASVAGSGGVAGEDVALALLASLNSTGSLIGVDGAKIGGAAAAGARSPSRSRSLAVLQGAGWYLDATLLASDSLRLLLDLHDLRTGAAAHRSVALSPGADAWALGVRGALELLPMLIPPGETAELPSLTGRNPAAVAEYFLGERAYRRAAMEEALSHFRSAVAADSGFGLAAIRGAQAANWMHQHPEAEALVAVALDPRGKLPPRQRELAEGMEAWLTGQADSAMSRFRRAVALPRATAESWMYLGETYNHLLPSAAPLDSLAEAAFREARARDLTFAPVLFHLIEFAIRRGDGREAGRLLQEYRRAGPDADLLGSLELGLRCIEHDLSRAGWEAAAKQTPARVFTAAQSLALGGLRQPACARAALESLLSADETYRFGALVALHGVLVAQGREDELRPLLARDTLFTRFIRGQLQVLAALAGAGFGPDADSFVGRELEAYRVDSTAPSNLDLWFAGSWLAHRGDGVQPMRMAGTILRRATGEQGRRDSLLAGSLAARATLALGDTTAAIARLGRLVPTTPSHQDLVWNPWESLGGERLLLAQLLLARGKPAAAYEVAENFDSPAPIAYLMYLPASLELRIRAARQLGDYRLADRLAARRQLLRSSSPPSTTLREEPT